MTIYHFEAGLVGLIISISWVLDSITQRTTKSYWSTATALNLLSKKATSSRWPLTGLQTTQTEQGNQSNKYSLKSSSCVVLLLNHFQSQRISPRVSQSDFVPSRVFRDAVKSDAEPVSGGPPQITSIAFEDSGKTCITAGEDDIFSYWDVLKGR